MHLNVHLVILALSRYNMKLYSVSDGPLSLACQQLLKALDIKYELINMDFVKGEHMAKKYEKVQF